MISIFISIGPLHKRQTTIKPQKLLNNAVVWSGKGAVPPPQTFWNFIPGNAKFWCVLVTIICGHWPIGGMILVAPHLNMPLIKS